MFYRDRAYLMTSALVAAALVLASGCADDSARVSLRKLKKQHDRLQEKVSRLEGKLATVKRINVKVENVQLDLERVDSDVAELQTQLQKLNASLTRLAALGGLADELAKLRGETEDRLTALDTGLREVKAAAGKAEQPVVVASGSPRGIGKLRTQVQRTSRKLNELDAKLKKLAENGQTMDEETVRKLVAAEFQKLRDAWRQRRGGNRGGGNRGGGGGGGHN